MNQELEQYLLFFVDHRQKDWLEWLALAEFTIKNEVYSTTKVSPFMANYERELRMGGDIRRKGKIEKAMKVCGKNEEDTKESRSSIEKDTGRNEEVCRSK